MALERSAAARIAVVKADLTPSLSNSSSALMEQPPGEAISSRSTLGWEPAVVSDIIPIALSTTIFCASDLLTPSATAASNRPSMASSNREPAHPTSTAETSNALSGLICAVPTWLKIQDVSSKLFGVKVSIFAVYSVTARPILAAMLGMARTACRDALSASLGLGPRSRRLISSIETPAMMLMTSLPRRASLAPGAPKISARLTGFTATITTSAPVRWSYPNKSGLDVTLEEFDRLFDANVRSNYLGSKVLIPEMKKNGPGSTIVISSENATRPGATQTW